MARPPKPWYRASRDAWFVTVGGRQVRLAEGRSGGRAARDAFHALMAGEARRAPGEAAPGAMAAGELVVAYIRDVDRRSAAGELSATAGADARRRVGSFAAECGAARADAVRPRHVQAWLDGKAWGPTTRHDAAAAVKAAFAWAARVGHLASDPLRGMPVPRRARRARVMGPDAYARFLAAIGTPEFRALCEFLYATSARPGEASRLEARHVDWARGTATLPGKNTRRTGRPRTLILNPAALAECRRLADAHPDGPIFRNSRGNPWTKNSINCQVRDVRRRAGLDGQGAVAYAIRHLYITDGLQRGANVNAIAEIADTSVRMIEATYGRLDDRAEYLRSVASVIRPSVDSDDSREIV